MSLLIAILMVAMGMVRAEPIEKIIMYGTDVYPHESPKPYPLVENLVLGEPVPIFFAPQEDALAGVLARGSRIDLLYAVVPEAGLTTYYKIRTEEGTHYYVPAYMIRLDAWKRTIRLEY